MNVRPRIPFALQIVAVLFLLYGIGCALGIVWGLLSGSINIDLGILGVPTYFGLRRLSTGWRTFALACVWIGLIWCPMVFVYACFTTSRAFVEIFSYRISDLPIAWLAVVSVIAFMIEFWQYRTLTRNDIRELFYSGRSGPDVS